MIAVNEARKTFNNRAGDKGVFSGLVKQGGDFYDLRGFRVGAIGFNVDKTIKRLLVGDMGAKFKLCGVGDGKATRLKILVRKQGVFTKKTGSNPRGAKGLVLGFGTSLRGSCLF